MGGRKSVPKSDGAKAKKLQAKQVAPQTLASEVPTQHKNKSVDLMSGDELKQYAAKVGISQRDIDGLTEDRLRQNCKVRIFESLEG